MHERDNWDAEWAGLEPGRASGRGSSRRWVLLLGLIVLVCLAGAALLAWQFLARTAGNSSGLSGQAAPASLATATAAGQPPTSTPGAQITSPPAVTLPDVTVQRLESAPRIDADAADWPAASTSVASAYLVHSAPSWDGSDDVSADWRLGWDEDNLYIFVAVSDDMHVQTQTGNQIFRGDGVSLQVDTQRDADLGPGVSPDDFQINLSPGSFAGVPPVAFRFRGSDNGRMNDAPDHQIVLVARPSAAGYALEAAIPWGDLALRPEAGLVLGAALNVNDNDVADTAVQEVMKSHVRTRTFNNPASWGTMTLE